MRSIRLSERQDFDVAAFLKAATDGNMTKLEWCLKCRGSDVNGVNKVRTPHNSSVHQYSLGPTQFYRFVIIISFYHARQLLCAQLFHIPNSQLVIVTSHLI